MQKTGNLRVTWMMCGLMRLATLQFETKLHKSIRMGMTTFKISIWGGISLDIRLDILSEIPFSKINFRPYIRRYTSPNENFEYSYPLISTVIISQFGPHFRLNNLLNPCILMNSPTCFDAMDLGWFIIYIIQEVTGQNL